MRTKKILLSLLLMFGMILGFMPMTAVAAEADDAWTLYAASEFAGGSGTKEDPYQIATAGQLAKLASEVNSGVVGKTHSKEYFKLMNSIDLSDHRWVPIGYGNASSKSFSGYFDGCGYKITGLYVDERDNNVCAGLFGVVVATTNEVVLKNIYIEDAKIYAGNETDESIVQYGAGTLVGSMTVMGGSKADYVAVENCHGSGTVDSPMYAGGLIGNASCAPVSDCTADTFVKGNTCSGGFVGFPFMSTFKNNTAKGNVESTGYSTGGFSGAGAKCTFEDNSASGKVESEGWSTGGFIGYDEESTITKCTASGNVKADNWNLGGFAGYLNGTKVSNSSAYGDVTGTLTFDKTKAGGFAGTNKDGLIKDSYAAGTVTGSNEYAKAGGFIAYDDNGTTEGCSFDKTKNPTLDGVGSAETAGTNDIVSKNTDELLADICTEFFGSHEYDSKWTIDKEASCTEEGSKSHHCIRCNAKTDITVIEKISHADIKLVKTEGKKATHMTDGVIDYWYCENCGKYFSDEKGTQEITLADTVIPKLTEHTADGTGWHTDGTAHWMVCECGEILDKAAHTEQTTITNKATLKKDGNSVTKCTICGQMLVTAKIAKVSKVTLSKKTYTYNGKAKKPAVTVKDSNGTKLKNGKDYSITYAKGRKKVGKYTAKITLKGEKYSGSKTVTFTIKPKNTKLTSKKGQKKAIVVRWKKQSKQTSGYQIQYATKKNFTNAKTVTVKKNNVTKKTIKKLASGKKYYVRIRTYKNVKMNGKTTKIASSWSKTSTVKTK